ncbi:MAG: hypothetical protein QM803_01550 [Rhodocyclaceae bacterium]
MPSSKSELRRGLDALRRGEWDLAHKIAQADESMGGHWLHGIAHTIEGDEGNARYWYAKAGRAFPGMGHTNAELDALSEAPNG